MRRVSGRKIRSEEREIKEADPFSCLVDSPSPAATWFLLAILALALLPGLFHRLRLARPRYAKRIIALPGYSRFAAACRAIGYHQPGSLWGIVPSTGPILTLGLVFIVSMVYCLAYQPWYRPLSVWGSSPLAIRAGLIANAYMPFTFILATKINPITLLTSISHEKLQVYHQWLARIVLVFGLLHGIAFCYQPWKDGGFQNLVDWWKYSPSTWNSGLASFALMAWIVASSTRVFRKMSYEFFVFQHVISVLGFLGVYFWHTLDMINSWAWLWPIVVVWGGGYLVRGCRAAMVSNFFLGTRSTVEIRAASIISRCPPPANAEAEKKKKSEGECRCEDRVLRISIRTPIRWKPGQHVFVRFPTVNPLQSHPFTIVNLPQPNPSLDSTMVLLAKVHGGATKKLWQHCQGAPPSNVPMACGEDVPDERVEMLPVLGKQETDDDRDVISPMTAIDGITGLEDSDEGHERIGTTKSTSKAAHAGYMLPTRCTRISSILDGPYGESASMASYDTVLLIAGGLGGTLILPILMDLALRSRTSKGEASQNPRLVTSHVRVVLAVRRRDLLEWYVESLSAVKDILEEGGVSMQMEVYVTCCDSMSTTKEGSAEDEKTSSSIKPSDGLFDSISSARPNLPTIINDTASASTASTSSMAVVVCGPKSMNDDTANAVARLQRQLISGGSSRGLKEVYLLKEGFNW